MDMQDIEIFARVAAVGNLSAVGSELGLTPGTISKRVQALEDELSVRLFERTTRSIRITEEGTRFLVHARRILTELDNARALVAETSGRPKGRLRIGACESLVQHFVSPAVAAFLAAFPEIDVHVDLTDQAVNLQDAGYDVAVVSGTLADSALIAKRLAADRQIVVASPSYIETNGSPRTPEDLASHACLARGDALTWTFQRDGVEACVRLPVRLRSGSTEMLRVAALHGSGLLRTSELHVLDDVRSGRLKTVLDDYDAGADAGIWALYAGGKHLVPRLRVFVDFLADWFRQNAARPPR